MAYYPRILGHKVTEHPRIFPVELLNSLAACVT